jgi:cell division protein FtsB
MPSSHDLKQDETILKLSRTVQQQVRKLTALSKSIAALEATIAKLAERTK